MTTTSIQLKSIAHPIVGRRAVVTKGLNSRFLAKGRSLTVVSVDEGDRRCARVVLQESFGKKHVFWAQHVNRLSDEVIKLNTGDPTQRLFLRLAPAGA